MTDEIDRRADAIDQFDHVARVRLDIERPGDRRLTPFARRRCVAAQPRRDHAAAELLEEVDRRRRMIGKAVQPDERPALADLERVELQGCVPIIASNCLPSLSMSAFGTRSVRHDRRSALPLISDLKPRSPSTESMLK